jgi:hypothetical protein
MAVSGARGKMKKGKYPLIVIAAILIVLLGMMTANRLRADYSQLNATDQAVLSEYDLFCSKERDSPLWQGFSLSDKTIVLMPRDSLSVYLVNPGHEINNVFAKKLTLPDTFSLEKVYRISALLPSIWKMKASGNFNTVGEIYSLFGDEIYYVKYDRSTSLEQQYTSEHFITFLSHEAFHYYMQNQWKMEENADAGTLSSKDLQLIRREYDVLEKNHQYFLKGSSSPEELNRYALQYVSIMDARMEANKAYTTSEISKETAEGTATYVGIKASELVGYDYGVMYFDNIKNVSFSDVFPQIDAGKLTTAFLFSRMPYETGALLCQMMDALKIPGWQEELNGQTPETPRTIYSVIKGYVK